MKTTAFPTLKYDLFNLPYDSNVVQNFFVGTKYLYALQLKHISNKTDRATYGYNAKVARLNTLKATAGSTYDKLDFSGAANAGTFSLNKSGHGQTLDYFQGKDGTGYLLIATKADPNDHNESGWHWDQQLARIKFTSGGSVTGNTSLVRLAHIKEAIDAPDLRRVGGAVSTDHNLLLIGGLDKEGNGYFSEYSMAEVNKKMDQAADGNKIVAADKELTKLRPTMIIENLATGALPQNSIQGFELDNYGNIYISSGQGLPYINGNPGAMPSVTKYDWNGNSHTVSLSDSKWEGHTIETEGIQIYNDAFYEDTMLISIAYKDSKKRKNRIYQFDMSVFN